MSQNCWGYQEPEEEMQKSSLGPPVGAAPTYQHLELRLLSYTRVRECKVLFLVTQPVIPYSNQRRHRWILSLFPFTDEESEEVTQSVWERTGLPAVVNSVALKWILCVVVNLDCKLSYLNISKGLCVFKDISKKGFDHDGSDQIIGLNHWCIQNLNIVFRSGDVVENWT